MELNLLEKTEIWIENLKLENANLTQLAGTVADVLAIDRSQVLVVDVRPTHITLDILKRQVDARDIFGKEKTLLAALGELPGVFMDETTCIHSDGILGMICLNEADAAEVIARMDTMSGQMVQRISRRAIVFPTGFEVSQGMIEDTNTPMIQRELAGDGYQVTVGPILDDDVDFISARLHRAVLDGYGLVITTGGVGAEDKDRSVEALLTVDPAAATPYIMKFRQGTGRHEKDGVRIGVGQLGQTMLVTLPGPNDEAAVGLATLRTALAKGLEKHETAILIADALTRTLQQKQQNGHLHHEHHHHKGMIDLEKQTIHQLADELCAARAEARAIPRLTDRFPDLSVQDAYAVQLVNIERRIGAGARIAGKKIGLTSDAMQKMLGVDEPDYGILMDDMIAGESEPVDTSRLIAPRIEAELAFILKSDIADAPNATADSVLAATEAIAPSFEIIDSAIAGWKMKIQDTVADNASSAALVLGRERVPVQGIPDLAAVRLVFRKNGAVIDEGVSSAVMGNPAAAVAWLANRLHAFGITLKAGEIILSGSLTKAYDVAAGDTFVAEFAGVGTVQATFG